MFTVNVLETALKAAALPREKFIVLQFIDGVVWLIDFTLLILPTKYEVVFPPRIEQLSVVVV